MRAFHRILGGLAALGLAAMASPAALAQGKINVGYVTASDFVPLLVAKEKGFFEKRGLDVEPKRIPIITNIPPALVSGDLQIGSSTMESAVGVPGALTTIIQALVVLFLIAQNALPLVLRAVGRHRRKTAS